MPSEGVREAPSYEVTPRASKGALGMWRALGGPGHGAGIAVPLKMGLVLHVNGCREGCI